ncbi:MAG: hypothetical protein JW922_01780 [Paludibacteraceae bacterium]|nr:hypothetical protein [Paludibacteraceae bacterium]
MNNKKLILGLTALALTAGAFLTVGSTYAYRGDYTQKGPDCDSEKHELMEQAFENNDYQAWAELMEGKGRVTQVINEGNFSRFAEAHKLAEEGNYDAADTIRQELGLRTRNGEKVGAGYMQGNGQGKNQGIGTSN